LVLDETLPADFPDGEVIIHLVPAKKSPDCPPTPEEIAQSQSGFAQSVLLDPAEDVWDHE
jgi:hypothetical protein